MNATARNGDVFTGEMQGGYYIYLDNKGNLYESLEAPAYRIIMDNAYFSEYGITPKEPNQ